MVKVDAVCTTVAVCKLFLVQYSVARYETGGLSLLKCQSPLRKEQQHYYMAMKFVLF